MKLSNQPELSNQLEKYMKLVKIKAHKAIKICRRNDIDVDDLISEGFLGLLSAIRTFDENKGSFESYANVCISNKIKNVIFAGNVLVLDNEFDIAEIADKQLSAEDIVAEKESKSEISSRLHQILSELELKVFTLYLDSYSYGAIAAKLSISIKAVDNALSRARSKLRKVYG